MLYPMKLYEHQGEIKSSDPEGRSESYPAHQDNKIVKKEWVLKQGPIQRRMLFSEEYYAVKFFLTI